MGQQDFTKRALNDAISAAIVPSAIVISILYGMLTILHPMMLEGSARWLMTAIAALSSITACVIAFKSRRKTIRLHATTVIAGLAAIAAINTISHFALEPAIHNTSNFVALCLGLGLVLLSRPWFYLLQGILLIAWFATVWIHNINTLDNWGWLYFFAFFVSITLSEQRIRATVAVASREALLTHRNQLLRQLVSASEWESLDLDSIHKKICRTANEELEVDATSIWLIDKNTERVGRAVREVRPESIELFGQRSNITTLVDAQVLLQSLQQEGVVAVSDIQNNPVATAVLGNALISSFRTNSVLISSIVVSGTIVGVVVHTLLVETRDWSAEDRAFSSSVADLAALAIQTHERSLLEKRTHQAERLESLGVLAGGVAHDFNNLLTVIMGNAELIHDQQDDAFVHTKVNAILQASNRARELAQQMLAYAGRASLKNQVIDIHQLTQEVCKELGTTLLTDVTLDPSKIQQAPSYVAIDVTQLRQVMMNLLTNSKDAGADKISVTTGQQQLDTVPTGSTIFGGPVGPGEYSYIKITDNGEGIRPITLERVFDPFFSTRPNGSGLGLAAVLGIVRTHNGFIEVESNNPAGISFKVFLPVSLETPEQEASSPELSIGAVTGKVFLLDDERGLADYVQDVLTNSTTEVTIAYSYQEFQNLLPHLRPDSFDLAIVDLTLGDGKGTEAVNVLRGLCPNLPVVIMSGYDASDALAGFKAHNTVAFLQKPFKTDQLLDAIDRSQTLVA